MGVLSKLRQVASQVKTETKQELGDIKSQYGKAKQNIKKLTAKKRGAQKSFRKAEKSFGKVAKTIGSVDLRGSIFDESNLLGFGLEQPRRKHKTRKARKGTTIKVNGTTITVGSTKKRKKRSHKQRESPSIWEL